MSYESSRNKSIARDISNEVSVEAPVLEATLETPNQYTLSWSSVFGFTNYQLIISVDDVLDFNDAVVVIESSTSYSVTATAQPLTSVYAQVRGYIDDNTTSEWSNVEFVEIPEAEALPDLMPQANAGNGQVDLTYTDSATGLDTIDIERREDSGGGFGSWSTLDTDIGSSPYTDNTVTNGYDYEYRLVANPTNFNYTITTSSVTAASPDAVTPQLSSVTSLQIIWDSVTEGSGEVNFVGVLNADEYEIYIDDVLETTLTAPDVDYNFSGLTELTQYEFKVIATATGYLDSDPTLVNATAPDLDASFISIDDKGGVPYYKPLDGRQYESFDFPLIDYEPLDQTAFDALGTGLTYSNYPNGVCKITAKTNDGVGTTVSSVFTASDVGKEFVGLNNHKNGEKDSTYVDLYAPFTITARYANVIAYDTSNGEWAVVDFEFNGGDSDTSQTQSNGQGYIYHDNTQALADAFTDFKNLTGFTEIRGTALSRSNYVLTAYVAPELEYWDFSGVTKDLTLGTGTSAPMRIKYGIEDRYSLEYAFKGGTRRYPHKEYRFDFADYTNVFVSYNVQWIPPHNSKFGHSNTNLVERMARGSLGGGGICFIKGAYQKTEYNELADGYGVDSNRDLFAVACGDVQNSGYFSFSGENTLVVSDVTGTFQVSETINNGVGDTATINSVSVDGTTVTLEISEGENIAHNRTTTFKSGQTITGQTSGATGDFESIAYDETDDVDEFGFFVHQGVDYSGSLSFGSQGGSSRGGTYYIFDDFTVNNEPRNNYGAGSQEFTAKFTTDFSGINDTGGTDDPNNPSIKQYMPSHCLEITSDEGNFFLVRYMGGYNRSSMLHFGRCIGLANNPRVNQIEGYYTNSYNGGSDILDSSKSVLVYSSSDYGGNNSVSNKKMIVDWEIPQVGNLVTISRDGVINSTEASSVTTCDSILRNSIFSHSHWVLFFQDYLSDLTTAELEWIDYQDKKPKIWQIDDGFRIAAWVEVDDLTDLAAGNSIDIKNSSAVTIATATIDYIDDTSINSACPYTKRLVLKDCSADITTADTIDNGSATPNVVASSSYDPTDIYVVTRSQRASISNLTANRDGFAEGEPVSSVKNNTFGSLIYYGVEKLNWVDCTNVTDLSGGDSVDVKDSGDTTLLSGEIYHIDGNRVYIYLVDEAATVPIISDISTASTITNGAVTKSVTATDSITTEEDLYFPEIINGDEAGLTNLTMVVDPIKSEAEQYLDGSEFLCRHSYNDRGKFASNVVGGTTEIKNWGSQSTVIGYGRSGRISNPAINYIDGYKSNINPETTFPLVGVPSTNLSYSRAETTYYLRNPSDWKTGAYRLSLVNAGNNSLMRPAGRTGYGTNDLSRFSKGYTIINVAGISRLLETEKGSSADQFDTQYTIYTDNAITTDPAYAATENMRPSNESEPYRPNVRVYGQDSIDYYRDGDETVEYPEANINIVWDSDVNNAPDLPQTILDIIASLPS